MSNIGTVFLISNGTATGNTAYWGGGTGCFVFDRGTVGGATVKLQASFDGFGLVDGSDALTWDNDVNQEGGIAFIFDWKYEGQPIVDWL